MSSLFSGQANPQQPQGGSLFANPQNSLFANPQANTQQGGSIFNNPQNPQGGNLFAQQQPQSQPQTGNTLFASNNPPANPAGLFAGGSNTPSFGGQTNTLFQNPQQQQQQGGTIFSNPMTMQSQQQPQQQSFMGAPQQQQPGMFQQSQQPAGTADAQRMQRKNELMQLGHFIVNYPEGSIGREFSNYLTIRDQNEYKKIKLSDAEPEFKAAFTTLSTKLDDLEQKLKNMKVMMNTYIENCKTLTDHAVKYLHKANVRLISAIQKHTEFKQLEEELKTFEQIVQGDFMNFAQAYSQKRPLAVLTKPSAFNIALSQKIYENSQYILKKLQQIEDAQLQATNEDVNVVSIVGELVTYYRNVCVIATEFSNKLNMFRQTAMSQQQRRIMEDSLNRDFGGEGKDKASEEYHQIWEHLRNVQKRVIKMKQHSNELSKHSALN